MAALTSQDYKAQRRGSRDTRRLRDFGYGTACGAVLAGVAFLCLSTRARVPGTPAAAPHPVAQPAPRFTASGEPATPLSYPIILATTEVPVAAADKDPRRALAAAHRGQPR